MPIPAINLQNSFTSAINASYSGMFGNGVSFNYAANDFNFLQVSCLVQALLVVAVPLEDPSAACCAMRIACCTMHSLVCQLAPNSSQDSLLPNVAPVADFL